MEKGERTESELSEELQWENKGEGFISVSCLLPEVSA